MKGSSFRDILAQYLEEESENPSHIQTDTKHFQPEPPPLLQWEKVNLRQTPKNGYPPPPPRQNPPKQEAKPARPIVPERLFKREQLPNEAQMALVVLITTGGVELEGGISRERLKKAHRRLVRALHPDRNVEVSGEKFLRVQSCYEILSQALKELEMTLRSESERKSA